MADQHQVDISKLTFEQLDRVKGYLAKLLEMGGSDLHLKAASPTRARVNGKIVVMDEAEFDRRDAITFAKELLRTKFPEFVENKEMDLTFSLDDERRFRCNIFFQMDGVSAVFRAIPNTKYTVDELGLPASLKKIIGMERGLVLVTGVTGSGKSTTLSALIHEINMNHTKHIITIEDPIEFVHRDRNCIINQRSVGMDTNSFSAALRGALREDPDIILVGEMRDMETIEMALHAAETGHLVFSTLHTLDAKETINRIVSIFPGNEQNRIRITLATVIQGVVSQRLVRKKDGGRVAAIEALYKTPRVDNLIRDGRDKEITEALQEGSHIYQTQTFDQHLYNLASEGVISQDEALRNATNASDLKLRFSSDDFAAEAEGGGENKEKKKSDNVFKLKLDD